jgi:DNA-binding transcriptional LysR family regulator
VGRSRLDGVDIGIFVEPRDEPQLPSISLGVSRMSVLMAAGHRLARRHPRLEWVVERVAELQRENDHPQCPDDPVGERRAEGGLQRPAA